MDAESLHQLVSNLVRASIHFTIVDKCQVAGLECGMCVVRRPDGTVLLLAFQPEVRRILLWVELALFVSLVEQIFPRDELS